MDVDNKKSKSDDDHNKNRDGIAIDWYGNNRLHHLFAPDVPNMTLVEKLLLMDPKLASNQNQFGRIALHYAVDRSKPHMEGIKLLMDYFPEGASVIDQSGMSPYDVAVKWNHSNAIMWLLLDKQPSIDQANYIKIKYGLLGSIASWASASFRSSSKTIPLAEEDFSTDTNFITPPLSRSSTAVVDAAAPKLSVIDSTILLPLLKHEIYQCTIIEESEHEQEPQSGKVELFAVQSEDHAEENAENIIMEEVEQHTSIRSSLNKQLHVSKRRILSENTLFDLENETDELLLPR